MDNKQVLEHALYNLKLWYTANISDLPFVYGETEQIIQLLESELKKTEVKTVPEKKSRHICNLWINPVTNRYEVDHMTHHPKELIAAYDSPTSSKWVDLTETEFNEIWRMDLNNKELMDRTISKLKQVNT